MTRAETLAWLRLIRTENIGPITFYKLLERFGSAENALRMLPQLSARGGRLKDLKLHPLSEAEQELERIEKFGARLITRDDADYPKLLAELEDAPPVITVMGNAKILSKPALGMVGARNASTLGRKIAEEFSAKVNAAGFVITSGLARGIDTSAHLAALKGGTVAVVAGGINVMYPQENEKLFHSIVEHGGAIVAESPFGVEPLARHFPRRNRIISGISLGVVVIEAALKSGSLITARMAAEQNREVFAVPGSPKDPRAEGTNALIKEGAHMATCAEDILAELRALRHRPLADSGSNRLQGALGLSDITQAPAPDETLYARVLENLNPTPLPVDELIRSLGAPAAEVLTVLLELELTGKVERHLGNRVSLT